MISATMLTPTEVQIMVHPLLTAGEELDLAIRAKAGDAAARDRLIACNMRLVLSVAKPLASTATELGDLIQEGAIGLMHAINGFDTTRGIRFTTYAVPWINQTIRRFIQNTRATIRVASSTKCVALRKTREGGALSKAESKALVELQFTSISAAPQVVQIADYCHRMAEHVHADELEKLGRAMGELEKADPRGAFIIRQRFGTDKTLQQVGDELGLTRERVRQIENESLKVLRDVMGVAA